jgi:site-specific recombinase
MEEVDLIAADSQTLCEVVTILFKDTSTLTFLDDFTEIVWHRFAAILLQHGTTRRLTDGAVFNQLRTHLRGVSGMR